MKKVRLALFGACGRMGVSIASHIDIDSKKIALTSVYEHANSNSIGKPYLQTGLQVESAVSLSDNAPFDVLVDFSGSAGTKQLVRQLYKPTFSIIVGSTKLTAHTIKKLQDIAQYTAVLVSPNMSIGIAIMKKAITQITKEFGEGSGISIHEAHHRHKTDAPSGTALALHDTITANLSRKRSYEMAGKNSDSSIPKHAISIACERVGEVIGDHTVSFHSPTETLSISHKATNRSLFAQGAIHASLWLARKKPGYYSMEQVLV